MIAKLATIYHDVRRWCRQRRRRHLFNALRRYNCAVLRNYQLTGTLPDPDRESAVVLRIYEQIITLWRQEEQPPLRPPNFPQYSQPDKETP